MAKCSDITAVIGCLKTAAGATSSVIIHSEYRTASNGNRTLHATRYTDGNNVPLTLAVGDVVTPGQCAAAANPVEKIVIPLSATGDVLGLALREVRTFNPDGTVASTTYYDTVTGAVATLPAGTGEVVETLSFDTEVVPMCDNGTGFLRKFVCHPSGKVLGFYDTTVDGTAPYVSAANPTPGACMPETLVANPVHWELTGVAALFQFPSAPGLATDFPGSNDASDFYFHALEQSSTGLVYSTSGAPFIGTEPDVLWANAQPALDVIAAAIGLPAGSFVALTDPATNQPVVGFGAAVTNPADFVFWAGPTGPGAYSAKLPASLPFAGATVPATVVGASTCTEGKAWYSVKTGALVRINTLDGVDVTADVDPLTLAEGACVAASVPPPDVEFEKLCDTSAAGVVTEFIRRTVTTFSPAGAATTVVADLGLDFATAYVPSGTVGACGTDCDVVAPVGVVTTWG